MSLLASEIFGLSKKLPLIAWVFIVIDFVLAVYQSTLNFERQTDPLTILSVLLCGLFGIWTTGLITISVGRVVKDTTQLIHSSFLKIPPLFVFTLGILAGGALYFLAAAIIGAIPFYAIYKSTQSFQIPLIIFSIPVALGGIYLYSIISFAWVILALHGFETTNPFKLSRSLSKKCQVPLFSLTAFFLIASLLSLVMQLSGSQASSQEVTFEKTLLNAVSMVAYLVYTLGVIALYKRHE